MKDRTKVQAGGFEEPGEPGSSEPKAKGSCSRRYGLEERKRLLAELEATGETMAAFCARHRVSTATICAWKRGFRTQGEAALVPRKSRGNPTGKTGRYRSPEERRAALEAFERSNMTIDSFARAYGVSPGTLRCWLKRFRAGGAKGLEPRARGRKKGSGGGLPRVGSAVREEIARTKLRFPEFGLKRVRDFLRRFGGVSVSTGTVRRTLEERGIERTPPRKKRRKAPRPRRFERSRPGELWQSDITSFVLSRPGTRVYLVVFLDDFSRYVVGFGLHVAMRSATVMEVLLEAIARYGKPVEVLTDQGPQYFTWRGKSGFQKLLLREGIRHVVARSHHPQTVGKCERLWETIGGEFWERARPQDLADARARLAHYFAHYNFFRPHQGIDGSVPADRFFGAENALRRTIESQLSRRELDEALEETPRRAVYLFGQIGDEQVSVVGEKGELVVQTSSGVRQRMGLDELGAPGEAQKEKHDGDRDEQHERDGDGRGDGTQAAPDGQETPEVRPAAALPSRSERAVAQRHGGGADPSAQGVHADPDAVAGPEAAGGGGRGAVDPSAAGLAALAAGPLGNAGGPAAPASSAASQPGDEHGAEGRGPEDAQEAHRGTGAQDRGPGGADRAAHDDPQAGEPGGADDGGVGPGDQNQGEPDHEKA